MNTKFLQNAVQNLVEIYERSLALLKNIETKCNDPMDPMDLEFIADSCKTLQSNEKLATLNRSILEETISVASKSTSITSETEPTVVGGNDSQAEEKYDPRNRRTPLNTVEWVDLANPHVTFNETVTVVNYSPTMETMPTINLPSTPSAGKPSLETKKSHLKKKRLLLPSAYVQRIQNGKVYFERKFNRTIGLCFFCDERKSYTKLQWQKHLLSHTKENFHFCKQCERTFSQRNNHITCSAALITNIYEQYNCVGEDYLAAFMCIDCAHVSVSETKMVEHLKSKHKYKNDYSQFYKKCNFVTNV